MRTHSLAMSADRIKAARELLGLSQKELSLASGLSQGLISQIERGVKPLTPDALQAIVSQTGLPWRFFEKPSLGVSGESLRFRKYLSASVKDTDRVRRTFEEVSDVACELLDWAEIPQPELPTMSGELHSTDDIEQFADEVRHAIGVTPGEPIRHLTRALERTSIPVVPVMFAGLSGEEESEFAAIGHFGVSGRASRSNWPIVGYFPGSGDRQRFTIAHEVGHLSMHNYSEKSGEEEREADRFAGALLFPKSEALRLLRSEMTLRDFAHVKAEWGISIQALIMRSYHLEIIDAERRTSLFKQVSARGWRRNEPVVVRNESPALLGMLLERRYGPSASLYPTAATETGLPAIQLRSTMPPHLKANDSAIRSRGDAPVIQLRESESR